MAYPQIVTGGRVTSVDSNNAEWSAGSIGDLIVIISTVSRPTIDGSICYLELDQLPAEWTVLATAEQDGTDETEQAKVIIAKVADSTDAGSLDWPKTCGKEAHISYRFAADTWEGSISGGVFAAFLDSDSLDPPNLDPQVGAQQIFWLAGIAQRASSSIYTPPTGFSELQYARSEDTSTNNNHYAMVSCAEREETAATLDPSVFVQTDGDNEAPRPFTIAVLPAVIVRAGITITDIKEPNVADEEVTGVENARVKVWSGTDDTGAEGDLLTDVAITGGTLSTGLNGSPEIDAELTVEVMWTVGTERKLFITDTTVIDLEAGT